MGTPAPVNGPAAAQTLLGFGTCTPGYCLKYVWNAYAAHGAVADDTYPTAYSAWLGSAHQVPGDRNVPEGFPCYLGPRPNSSAGDVMISLGGGQFAATDWPRNGLIGICTLAQREAQTGRPYLGWTRDILGNPIDGDDMNKQDVKDAMFEFFRDVNSAPAGHDRWPFFDAAVWQNPRRSLTTDAPPVDYDELARALSAQGITIVYLEPEGRPGTRGE